MRDKADLQLEPKNTAGALLNASSNGRKACCSWDRTRDGRRHFDDELANWRRMSRAITLVLEVAG